MNSDYRQWLRKWCITVSGGGAGLNVSNLRCAFNVLKAVEETPNLSILEITNLAISSISQIGIGDLVTIEAGYENGNYGLIFSGNVVRPYIEKSGGVDTNLVLVCQDADVFLNTAFTAKTLEKGSTLQDVVTICSSGEGVTQGLISKNISSAPPFIRGKVLFGKNADYLKRAAYATTCQFYVEDGEINIIAAEDYKGGTAVELTPDTGLVGDPSQTDNGVSARCLINPSLKLNTLVHISSDYIKQKRISTADAVTSELAVDGIYRVVKINYVGDTHGDDWYCDFDAIAQDGANPAGAASSGAASSGSSSASSGGQKKSVIKQLTDGENPWR